MKIYQTFAPTPSRVQGLLRLLLSRPQARERRARLADLFHPPRWRGSKTPLQYFRETLDALVELELAVEEGPGDDDSVRAADSARAELASLARYEDVLPRLVARVALAPQVGGQVNRFALICGWFLLQPVCGIPSGHGPIKTALLSVKDRPGWQLDVDNDNRLDMVVYWARYLGLLAQLREAKCEGLLADPSPYLRRYLGQLLPGTDPVPVQQFRADLGKLCPVLDGGAVRQAVLEAFAPNWPDHRLSPALAHALRRLEKEGRVELVPVNDARPENFLLLGNDRVAKIRRLEGGSA